MSCKCVVISPWKEVIQALSKLLVITGHHSLNTHWVMRISSAGKLYSKNGEIFFGQSNDNDAAKKIKLNKIPANFILGISEESDFSIIDLSTLTRKSEWLLLLVTPKLIFPQSGVNWQK